MFGAVLGLVSAGLSLFGASENARMAQEAITAQSHAAEAQREATATGLIAQVSAQNHKAEDLDRTAKAMKMTAKAQTVMREEKYNQLAAIQMVAAAASGRITNSGSVNAIFSKSHEDYKWDQLWNDNKLAINLASIQRDKTRVYEAGATALRLGALQLEVQRETSEANIHSTAAQANQAYSNTVIGVAKSFIGAFA